MLACTAARSASSGARTASSDRSLRPVVSHTGGCDIQMTAPRRSLPAIFMPVMSVPSSLACCRLAASRSASRSTAPFEPRKIQHRALHGGAGEIGKLQLRAGEIGALQRGVEEVDALRLHAARQVGLVEVRVGEAGAGQQRVGKIGAVELRLIELGAAQVDAPQARPAELGARQVDVARRDALGRHAIVAQHDDVGLGAVKRRLLQVGADEAGAVEAGAGQVGAARGRCGRAWRSADRARAAAASSRRARRDRAPGRCR